MTKQQITEKIKEVENTLASLRTQLTSLAENITSFNIGDVFKYNNVYLIVSVVWTDREIKYHFIGNEISRTGYMNAWSDCPNGYTKSQMISHINKYMDEGAKYVGNISSAFDELMKAFIRKNPV